MFGYFGLVVVLGVLWLFTTVDFLRFDSVVLFACLFVSLWVCLNSVDLLWLVKSRGLNLCFGLRLLI